jgi:hypothetical protein
VKQSSNNEVTHSLFFCFVFVVFLGLPAIYALHVAGFFGEFRDLKLNEKGDALAGIFGSLAFVAAAIAVVMQSIELRAQREELKLTREVMDAQKKATEEMAKSMAVQAESFLEDQKQRSAKNCDQILEEKMQFLLELIDFYRSQLNFEFEVSDCGLIDRAGLVELTDIDPTRGRFFLFDEKNSELGVEAGAQKLAKDLYFIKESMDCISAADFEVITEPRHSGRLVEIVDLVSDIVELRDRLSEAGRTKYTRLRISKISKHLNEIKVNPIWVHIDE